MSNCTLHADANTGHAFGIFMASVSALRLRLRRRLTLALGGGNQGSGSILLVMHATAKLLRKLNMREQRIWPRLLSGDSTSRTDWVRRLAISPSAAGEPAGMFTTHTPSPLGLPVLFGSQRTIALR
jgi:hypothetical protein